MMRRLLCGSLVLVVWGCGGEPTPPTVPVNGSVFYSGKPVVGATITFSPTTLGNGAFVAFAVTQADGRFTLRTALDGSTDKDGAVAGKYVVTVVKTALNETATTMAAKSVEETRKRMGDAHKNRTRPSPRKTGNSPKNSATAGTPAIQGGIPVRYASAARSPLQVLVPQPSYDLVLTDE